MFAFQCPSCRKAEDSKGETHQTGQNGSTRDVKSRRAVPLRSPVRPVPVLIAYVYINPSPGIRQTTGSVDAQGEENSEHDAYHYCFHHLHANVSNEPLRAGRRAKRRG